MEVVALGVGVVLVGFILAVLAVAWILRSPFLWGQFQDVIADMTQENQELREELAANGKAIRELNRELQRAELRIDRLQQHAEDAAMHSELLAARLRALGQLDIPPTPQPPPRLEPAWEPGQGRSGQSWLQLATQIKERFSLSEVNDLAMEMGLDGVIQGGSLEERASSLVVKARKRERLGELVVLCRRKNPSFDG